MRVVGFVHHPGCQVTLYEWNNKYLIKLDSGWLEQTFKISIDEFNNEEELKDILTAEFMNDAIRRFSEMSESLGRALQKM